MENTTLEDLQVSGLTILQLAEQVQRRLAAIEWFIGLECSDARARAVEKAREAVQTLAQRVDNRASWAHAHNTCALLFGELDPPAKFWATPLGADIAWAIGYPHEQVPQWAAAAVLNCSRIAVFRAVREQRLELTALSLRRYLRNMPRWDAWSKELEPDGRTMQPGRQTSVPTAITL